MSERYCGPRHHARSHASRHLPQPPPPPSPPLMYRSFASGQVPVHWVVHFDARGERAFRYRCKNVNLVEKTVKGVEDELEFLFVP